MDSIVSQVSERLLGETEVTYTKELTREEDAFVQWGISDDIAAKMKAASAQGFGYDHKCLKGIAAGTQSLPDAVRPQIHLFGIITHLAWFEVLVVVACMLLSTFGWVRCAQATILLSFLACLKLKVNAVFTLTSTLHGDVLDTFLNSNYCLGTKELPVRKWVVAGILSLVNFAEGALTAIALREAWSAAPEISAALALVLVWSLVVHIYGVRSCIHTAKLWMLSSIGDIVNGWEQMFDQNMIWHSVTMAAASSNLMLIASCGDCMTKVTLEKQPACVYKMYMHAPFSVSTRVWNKGIFTAVPRIALKIILFQRMGQKSVSDRLNMFLAIVSALYGLLQLMHKSFKSVMARRDTFNLMVKDAKSGTVPNWRTKFPYGEPSLAKILLCPFEKFTEKQVATIARNPTKRKLPFDPSLYTFFVLTAMVSVCVVQMLNPTLQLIQDSQGAATAEFRLR